MANYKISQLPAATEALAADEHEVNQAGTSKKVTGTQLGELIFSQKRASNHIYIYEEWMNSAAGSHGWTTAASGAGAAESVALGQITNQHPGVLTLSTGTTTTGRSGRSLGAVNGVFTTGYMIGGGPIRSEWLIRAEDLSTAGEEYTFVIGSIDAVVSATAGVYFFYNRTTSVNWQCITRDSSTNTTTITAVPFAADTWTKLRTEVNAAGTSVTFYINDVLVGTHSTNLPSIPIAPNLRATKSAGTTARLIYCDYFEHIQTLTTSR